MTTTLGGILKSSLPPLGKSDGSKTSGNHHVVIDESHRLGSIAEDAEDPRKVTLPEDDAPSESSGYAGSEQSLIQDSREWDPFISKPEPDLPDDTKILQFITITAKYLTILVFGGAVLLGSIASTGSLLVVANAYTQDYNESGCQATDGNYTDVRYNVMLMLMTCLLSGEAFTVMYSIYRIVMKGEDEIRWPAFFWGLIHEILNAVGLAFLVIFIIPNIDSTLAVAAFTLVGTVPASLHIYAKNISLIENAAERNRKIQMERRLDFIFAICALAMQLIGIVLLSWQIAETGRSSVGFCIATAFSLLLISCRYWENFVTVNIGGFFKTRDYQRDLDICRFKTGFLYAIIRSAVIIGLSFFIYYVVEGHPTPSRISNFTHECSQMMTSLWYAVLTHGLCGLGVFYFGRLACQTMVHIPSYSLALVLATVVLFVLTSVNSMCVEDVRCNYNASDMMEYFFNTETPYAPFIRWKSDISDPTTLVLVDVFGSLLGLFGLVLLTPYLWRPNSIILERTENLFVKPIYGGVLINQSMMMNLRQYIRAFRSERRDEDVDRKRPNARRRITVHERPDSHPQIYLCATMWHETEREMTKLLTSILRLEKDHAERLPGDKDYCNFQVHVIFDDAMTHTPEGRRINEWVAQLLKIIPLAEKSVFGDYIEDPLFISRVTPYGGRIELVLPAGNLLHIHLKDKSLIRHRKRWSQCMYLYYIMSYLRQTHGKAFNVDDTYILALDGDVDFQPNALHLLVQRMKKNPDVGAACGRIHPVGSGPVAWFQKFEYAVGHWLQKTAEHVLGCVLCSPGCFSLFRGKALMSENVVKTYTTRPTEAKHYVQWDQGEDRWLCTLLLKQGWRIEYCAASESYTFCPKKFNEFYNQRRRWGPSTMANIFDILLDASRTVKRNKYISWGYVVYQCSLMVASLLGPATVIMMIQGGFQFVFVGISEVGSLMLALIPVVIFVIICFTAKPDFQLLVAGILTIAYSFVMMAVLVGIIGLLVTDYLNPSGLFMIALMSMYAFAGLIHPTEALCLIHGILYYLCVPSAFIFLMLYSLCNLHDVSWGTREVKTTQQPVVEEDNKSNKEKRDKKSKSKKNTPQKPSEYTCGCGSFCQIQFCIEEKPIETKEERKKRKKIRKKKKAEKVDKAKEQKKMEQYTLAKSKFMGHTNGNVDLIRRSIRAPPTPTELNMLRDEHMRRQSIKRQSIHEKALLRPVIREEDEAESSTESALQSDWIADETLQKGKIREIDGEEKDFWENIIDDYLLPLDENKEEQDRIKSKLKSLKNQVAGGYIFINGLWITLTFFLNLTITSISISYIDANGIPVTVQPLAFIFLIFYIVILLIQFLSMLVHRWSTFIHLMAQTSLLFWKKRSKLDKRRISRSLFRGFADDNSVVTQQPSVSSYINTAFEDDSETQASGTKEKVSVHQPIGLHNNKVSDASLQSSQA